MRTWHEIGVQTYRDAVALRDDKRYRSAVARFYYSVFAIVTDELVRRKAQPKFAGNRATPSHAQIASLVDIYFTNISEDRRKNIVNDIASLYRTRLLADYTIGRIDKVATSVSMRTADAVFKALGVHHDIK